MDLPSHLLCAIHCRKSKEASAVQASSELAEEPTEEIGHVASWQIFLTVIREWRIWWLALIWAIVCFGMDGLISWIPLLIQ